MRVLIYIGLALLSLGFVGYGYQEIARYQTTGEVSMVIIMMMLAIVVVVGFVLYKLIRKSKPTKIQGMVAVQDEN